LARIQPAFARGRSIRADCHLRYVLDDDKPRRSRDDELAELADSEARKHAVADARLAWVPLAPSLAEIVANTEADDEAAYQARERAETSLEREESARILAIEAKIEAERPILRARELRRTFARLKPTYAAAAAD
jgi:hypothetical protein